MAVTEKHASTPRHTLPKTAGLPNLMAVPRGEYGRGRWSNSVTGRLASIHSPLRQSDGTLSDTLEIVLERDVHGAILDTLARVPSYLTFLRGGAGTFRRYYRTDWWHRPWGDGPAATLLVERVRPVRDLDAQERKEIRLELQVPPGTSEWDVLDREGRYLGAVVIPETEWVGTPPRIHFFQDRATGKWYMYSIWYDELGLQYVVRWRIDGRMPG